MVVKRLGLLVLFVVAALYDGILGLAFLWDPNAVFAWGQVTPPNHLGYVQFPGALLIIFALMFLAVAIRPRENRTLIAYGVLLKLAYCGIAISYWVTSGIPSMFKPFAVIDLVFLVLFVVAYRALGEKAAVSPPAGVAAGS